MNPPPEEETGPRQAIVQATPAPMFPSRQPDSNYLGGRSRRGDRDRRHRTSLLGQAWAHRRDSASGSRLLVGHRALPGLRSMRRTTHWAAFEMDGTCFSAAVLLRSDRLDLAEPRQSALSAERSCALSACPWVALEVKRRPARLPCFGEGEPLVPE